MSKTKLCTHIKVTGVRCGSPALREAEFCYFHQRMLRTVKGPKSRIHPVALLENAAAIQSSVMEVVNGLIRGTIDLKRGELILRALNIATRNSRHAHFGLENSDMVTRIPDYTEVEDPTPTVAEMYEKVIVTAATAAQQPTPTPTPTPTPVATPAPSATVKTDAEKATVETAHKAIVATAHVGTGTPARPGGAEVSRRSPPTTKTAPAITSAAIDPTQRKQPMSVKELPTSAKAAPKERKIAAHRASGG